MGGDGAAVLLVDVGGAAAGQVDGEGIGGAGGEGALHAELGGAGDTAELVGGGTGGDGASGLTVKGVVEERRSHRVGRCWGTCRRGCGSWRSRRGGRARGGSGGCSRVG